MAEEKTSAGLVTFWDYIKKSNGSPDPEMLEAIDGFKIAQKCAKSEVYVLADGEKIVGDYDTLKHFARSTSELGYSGSSNNGFYAQTENFRRILERLVELEFKLIIIDGARGNGKRVIAFLYHEYDEKVWSLEHFDYSENNFGHLLKQLQSIYAEKSQYDYATSAINNMLNMEDEIATDEHGIRDGCRSCLKSYLRHLGIDRIKKVAKAGDELIELTKSIRFKMMVEELILRLSLQRYEIFVTSEETHFDVACKGEDSPTSFNYTEADFKAAIQKISGALTKPQQKTVLKHFKETVQSVCQRADIDIDDLV